MSSSTTTKTVPLPPAVPTASATVQPTCATPSGTITHQLNQELNIVVAYQSSNSFAGLAQGVILYMSETLLTQVV
jgi:hypothetical protein